MLAGISAAERQTPGCQGLKTVFRMCFVQTVKRVKVDCSSEGQERFYKCAARGQNKFRHSISCRLKNNAVALFDTEN
ncbi:MAG: hypothetical protein DME77_03380 [Verrucomicrobia bacterium]|nr:MAG: hypothetical protein DME77_03380 [Verrucomicrobiota bacterium]